MNTVLEPARDRRPPSFLGLTELVSATGGNVITYVGNDSIRIAAAYVSLSDARTFFRIQKSDLPLDELLAYAHGVMRPSADQAAPKAVPLHQRLITVKSTLGLSTKELAEVMGCARATIYLWLAADYQGQVNEDALKRLSSLEKLSHIWGNYAAGALGGNLHGLSLQEEDGRSLYSLLKEAAIDISRCERALRAIANHCRKQIAVSQRLDERISHGFGV